jgi:hypothetical protein
MVEVNLGGTQRSGIVLIRSLSTASRRAKYSFRLLAVTGCQERQLSGHAIDSVYSLLAHTRNSLLSKGALVGQPGEPRSLLYPYRFPSYVTACGMP